MPVFINEVVIRANVQRADASAQGGAAPAAEPVDRAALVADVKEALMAYLERQLDRIGER
ncbi:MAG: DUF5908 family protein [Sphingomonadales bacterium]